LWSRLILKKIIVMVIYLAKLNISEL